MERGLETEVVRNHVYGQMKSMHNMSIVSSQAKAIVDGFWIDD